VKRILLTSLLLGLIYLPFSCNRGCENFIYHNNIADISIEFGVLTPYFEDRDTASFDSATWILGISEVERVSETIVEVLSLYPSALAEECGTYTSELHHELLSVEVTNHHDLIVNGTTYTSGSILNDLFRARPSQDQSLEVTVAEIADIINQDKSLFADQGSSIYFRLAKRPDQIVTGDFVFTLTFDDRTLTTSSPFVTITP
jgi:hypothetical protein